jgi:thiosulfate/3-mercaptopyruvate sulfurtransferase
MLVGAGCGSDAPEEAALEEYAKDVLVDSEWIEENWDAPSVRVLEIGGDGADFEEGHLPGAAFLAAASLTNPDDAVGSQIATGAQLSAALGELGVTREHTVVLYDRSGNLFAARAYWVLKYYQHPDVRIYNGGASKWTADARALTTGAVEHAATDYLAGAADPEIRTTWQYVMDHTDDPSTLMCDARSPDEHLGRDVRAERGGHIPGAVNLEWSVALNADGTFKNPNDLARLYEGAGFTRDKQIITYCQSGVRGAHTWFVLSELLGYPDVRNYDGSWLEYGNRAESVIEG